MKTLIWKEIRECVRWLPLGWILVGAICYMCLPAPRNYHPPQIASLLVSMVGIVAGVAAFLLAAAQIVPDLRNDARAFLMHRGVTARSVFWAKVVAGFCIYGCMFGVPLAIFAAVLGRIGLEQYPVRPAQVVPALAMTLCCFSIYPASVTALTRSSAWFGTKLLPLVFPIAACFTIGATMLYRGGLSGVWVSLPFTIGLLALLFWEALLAWHRFPSEPETRNTHSAGNGFATCLNLTLGSLIALAAGLFIVGATVETFRVRQPNDPAVILSQLSHAFDTETGEAWLTNHAVSGNAYPSVAVMQGTQEWIGGRISANEDGRFDQPVPEGKSLKRPTTIYRMKQDDSATDYSSDGFFSSPRTITAPFGQGYQVYDRRGYVLQYAFDGRETRLQGIISREGFHSPTSALGEAFDSNPITSLGFLHPTLASLQPFFWDDRAYSIDIETGEWKAIIDQPIDFVSNVFGLKYDELSVYAIQANRLDEFMIKIENMDRVMPRVDQLPFPKTEPPQLTVTKIGSVDLDLSDLNVSGVGRYRGGYTLFAGAAGSPRNYVQAILRVDEDGALRERIEFEHPAMYLPPDNALLAAAGAMPPCYYVGIAVFGWFVGTPDRVYELFEGLNGTQRSILATSFLVFVVGVAGLVFWLCRQRLMSTTQTAIAMVFSVFLGLAMPIAVIALFPRPKTDRCPNCERARRIDEIRCADCSATWNDDQDHEIQLRDRQRQLLEAC